MFGDVITNLLAGLLLLTAMVGCGPAASTEAAETTETDLAARIEAPIRLKTGETLNVTFTLTNNTDAELYVLTWYTPLEGIAGEIFRVERDGQALPYRGILASRAAPLAEDYVLLRPGASASAEVDLATAYDVSRAGTYTVAFLSPSISHVARSEAEMATSLDDLGPVQMPSNTVTVAIAGSAERSDRLTCWEAEAVVRHDLRRQRPDLSPDVPFGLVELPARDVWEQLPVQIFRATEGPFARETFLIRDGSALRLGTAVGGPGVTSLRVSDLDRDGTAELLFTYGFGSGIHQSRVAMYAPAYGDHCILEAATGYGGDLGLLKEGMGEVSVRVVQSDDETQTLRFFHTLGHLSIERHAGRVELVLQLARDLPDDVRGRVMTMTPVSEEGARPG